MRPAPSLFRQIGHTVTGVVMLFGGATIVKSGLDYLKANQQEQLCNQVFKAPQYKKECTDVQKEHILDAQVGALEGTAFVSVGAAGYAAVSFADDKKRKNSQRKINGPQPRLHGPKPPQHESGFKPEIPKLSRSIYRGR